MAKNDTAVAVWRSNIKALVPLAANPNVFDPLVEGTPAAVAEYLGQVADAVAAEEKKRFGDEVTPESATAETEAEAGSGKPEAAPQEPGEVKMRAKRRTREELALLQRQVVKVVIAGGGDPLSVADIARTLGVTTEELVDPIKTSLAAGEIRREGERRATRYFPVPRSAEPTATPEPAE